MKSILFAYPVSDGVQAELWALGCSGIIETDAGLRAFFADEIDLTPVHELGATDARAENETTEFAKENWHPILAGERFFIAPPWVDEPTPAGRIRLTLESSIAFGTGRHESTQLMLQALERCLSPGQNVIDVGCGSGILSKAALLLGAGTVIGCDVDSVAARAARELGIDTFAGSADAIRTAQFDIVLANITPRLIDLLAFELRRIVKPDGLVLLCGFVSSETPKSFSPAEELTLDDWCCWICHPDSYAGSAVPTSGLHSQEWW